MFDTCGFWMDEDDFEKKSIYNIEYAKDLYDEQVAKVKKEKYIENLMLADYIRAIRSYKTRYDYIEIFKAAQSQIGNKLKKDRNELETVKHFIMEDFLNNDKNFKLTNIVSCGHESYGWNIELEGYGVKFCISIPVKGKITTENLSYTHNGMFAFVIKESDYVWSTKKASYKIEDIACFIKEYFKLEDKDGE